MKPEPYFKDLTHSERDTVLRPPEWEKAQPPRDIELELTARCNNACRHCYINLPENDLEAKSKEMSFEEVKRIVDEAVSLGVLGCLVTGGEPLLKEYFSELYLYLKRKGLLVTVFTNATLITEEHVELFRKYPPRKLEISVYGVTRETYERLTRIPGTFDKFMHGLNLLLAAGIRVSLKTMAIRSNFHELQEIGRFCRERASYFRFDPWLHLRLDRRLDRNEEILRERLTPEEFVALEKADPERWKELTTDGLMMPGVTPDMLLKPEMMEQQKEAELIRCGAGRGSFSISYDMKFRACSSFTGKDWAYDLRQGTLKEAYFEFIESLRALKSSNPKYIRKCYICALANICLWCPANSYLETGEPDTPVDYFCQVAQARAKAMGVDPRYFSVAADKSE
jgi:radical SAM protein with 4Fe4S-binding SPASM domain